jgi:hypothetical protein
MNLEKTTADVCSCKNSDRADHSVHGPFGRNTKDLNIDNFPRSRAVNPDIRNDISATSGLLTVQIERCMIKREIDQQ